MLSLLLSKEAMQANKHELERKKWEVGIKEWNHFFSVTPVLTHLSSAGQRKAGTEWTCQKLTPPCKPTAPCKNPAQLEIQESKLEKEQGSSLLLLQEGRPLPGPQSELSSNTWKWIVWGDTCVDKPRDFIEKGGLGGEQQESPGGLLCHVSQVLWWWA